MSAAEDFCTQVQIDEKISLHGSKARLHIDVDRLSQESLYESIDEYTDGKIDNHSINTHPLV